MDEKAIKIFQLIYSKYLPVGYYNSMSLIRDLLDVAKDSGGKLTVGQYKVIFDTVYKYRKSILRKIFNV